MVVPLPLSVKSTWRSSSSSPSCSAVGNRCRALAGKGQAAIAGQRQKRPMNPVEPESVLTSLTSMVAKVRMMGSNETGNCEASSVWVSVRRSFLSRTPSS